MDGQKKPRSRERRIVNEGKGVERQGEGLGTGPVNNTGNYEDRKEQERDRTPQRPAGETPAGRTSQGGNPFGQQGTNPFGQQGMNPFGQRPQGGAANPFGSARPSGNAGSSRPGAGPFGQKAQGGGTAPFGAAGSSGSSGSGQKQYRSAVKQNGTGGGQRAGGTGSGGGGGKLILIIAVIALLFGGGSIGGLFGGGNNTQTTTGTTGGSAMDLVSSILGGENGISPWSESGSTGVGTTGSVTDSGSFGGSLQGGSGGLGNLLSTFLGSGSSSVYDFSGSLSGSQGQSSVPTSSEGGAGEADETVTAGARDKFTVIKGKKKDTVTLLVYMCGTDLESQQGMATADLKEMLNASFGENVNLIVYTGGCNRWKNNVVSSRTNQIYQVKDGGLYCLEDNLGTASMTNPETLAGFIRYGQEHFPANRMCLIFWDHGGGSVSGFGYDERYGHNQSMTLAGINTALKNAGVKFDFIGFDACLMATVENGIMLSQYGDYMIASEETEPGVGWYYTNWLTQLGKNTSMPTVQIGKLIADDFVAVCEQKCRGQATTLSVVDLAELQATVPKELKEFSVDTNELIQNKEYKTVSTARGKTREFARQSRIDQIDLVHFANNMGTKEGKDLAKAIRGAVKYNRTGGGMQNAYGLSIYFPYQRTNKVSQMVSTYKAIGMDEEYTRCIQEFASMEVSGQISAGTPVSYYGGQSSSAPGGLMNVLLGQGGGYSSSSYSSGGLTDLLGGVFGGSGSSGSTGSVLDFFMGRSLTADKAAEYILDNHFDASQLVWRNGRITLPQEQWGLVTSLVKNLFYDDGRGFIDLGTDAQFELDGGSLTGQNDGYWISINRQPVAYYYLGTEEEGDAYLMTGYVPAFLNGERVNLILCFDNERPYGYIAGAQTVYEDGESDTQAKTMISVGSGDRVQFICDYYDYDGNYMDSYKLGKEMVLGDEVEIADTPVSSDLSRCRTTYCFTDIYRQRYWTPAVP